MRKFVALVQARMTSSRLPGKTLIPINGMPLLQRVLENIKDLKFVDEVFVLTSCEESDDSIDAFCKYNDINVLRGDRLNVFNRYLDAITELKLSDNDFFIRFTADNPILDYSSTLEMFKIISNQDYVSIENLSHIVPEFIKVGAFKKLSALELDANDFEHVTFSFRGKYKNIFDVELLPNNFNGLKEEIDHLLTVDDNNDFERINKFFIEYDLLEKNQRNIYKIIGEKNRVKLNGKFVGNGLKPFIIGEIGQNHNGSIDLAKELIDIAYRSGVDAVKFQKRDINSDLTDKEYRRPYDSQNSFGKTYGEHREFLEFNEKQHLELKTYCELKNLIYFCTPCDIPSLEALERIGCPFYKVASRDLTNDLLLERLSKINKPVIISTGMATYDDLDHALKILNKSKEMLIIMQCTSQYPCSFDNVHLNVIKTLRDKYNYLVGFSDHTLGTLASVIATTKGAVIIEKHITIDRAMKGTDQPGSLEEFELKRLVEEIEISSRILGSDQMILIDQTKEAIEKLRKSIVAAVEIKKGQLLDDSMITLKSPGNGLTYRQKKLIIGKKSIADIPIDTTLKLDHFE